MEYVADLHVHSKYSRAVSRDMVLPIMDIWAKKKGIDILTTADWTHHLWFREIRSQLEESSEGLFKLQKTSTSEESLRNTSEVTEGLLRGEIRETLFILSTEISSIYSQGGKTRRIHNLVFSPSFETCGKINQELIKRGCNLSSDGRPIIGISSRNLLELILSIDERVILVPCHAWTPWFSLYGSNSGFDSIEECFGDYSKYIYAVETGLSSDPEMNWRIKELENRSIISNSDSHSPPKMGREATVFAVKNQESGIIDHEITYKDIINAIKEPMMKSITSKNSPRGTLDTRGTLRIRYTIEFYPEEGKYHYSGHRNCKVVQDPRETSVKGNICPVCKRPLTLGVMHRVDELAHQQVQSSIRQLADKVQSYEETVVTKLDKYGVKWYGDPKRIHPPYIKLVPLNEIIAESISSPVASVKVKALFDEICEKFKNEINVLTKTPIEEIENLFGPKIAEGIKKVRIGDIALDPGYDGEYGKVKIWKEEKEEEAPKIEFAKKDESQLGLF